MDIEQLISVGEKLTDFVGNFSKVFGWTKRVEHCKIYLSGLLLDGERKSIDPIADRIDGADNQALQQFVNQSPWDGFDLQDALRRHMIKRFRLKETIYVLDDTSLPKKGKHSVGVAHQYCGALGKIANCQSIVSFQAVTDRSHFPLAARLYLPKNWTNDPKRMKKVGVPKEFQAFKEKWKIALDLLDQSRADVDPSVILFDAGYGGNRIFLKELDDRDLRFIGGLKGDETFWSIDAKLKKPGCNPIGRKSVHEVPEDLGGAKLTVKDFAKDVFDKNIGIKKLVVPHKKPINIEFFATRVREIVRRPRQHAGPERWLIIERLRDGSFKYFVSNYDADVNPEMIVLKAHQRYKIELGYQQLKEELGLDHFEGRSWNGLHHHIALCFMAFNFLQSLVRNKGRGKK